MKILVTGALGFIGASIVNSLGSTHDIDILDGFDLDYVGYKFIHRGNQGLQPVNAIEKQHRLLNLDYRLSLVRGKFSKLYKSWSFDTLPNKYYDLIINCGALSEAILSQYFEEFTYKSIVTGLENLKKKYPDARMLHISSSMVYGSWSGKITEQAETKPVDKYGVAKLASESLCTNNDIVLRPIHVYGMGDGKFSVWMNLDRQLAAKKPLSVENASCIYIKDFVKAVNKIIDNWNPGVYNISYDFVRDGNDIQEVYKLPFEYINKSGPTGRPRGLLSCEKLLSTFNLVFEYKDYLSTIEDYYNIHENFCKK